METNIHNLIERIKKNDPEAVAEFFSRFHVSALKTAYNIVKNYEIAEDVVQEAFLDAINNIGKLKSKYAFTKWFHNIVRNLALKYISKKPLLELKEDVFYLDSKNPRKILQKKEIQNIVRQTLNKLPENEKKTTELFYLDDLSCFEIAQFFNIPEGTIKRRLHYARKKLKKYLKSSLKDDFYK